MRKRFRKTTAVVLVVVLMIVITSMGVVSAGATQNRYYNFNSGYSISGSGANDMVSIAAAQLGLTGSQLGYSEQWCADFVSDCAILANQSDAIPAAGYCPTLRQNIINSGGWYVDRYSAQAGDIVFYGNNGADHVEIVYAASGGNVSTYGGNSGSAGNLYSRSVKQHPTQTQSIAYIVRPNYKNGSNHNPIGSWDSISSGGIRRIRVTGWAYDLDDPNASLDIHVYVGGPAGSGAPCYVINADVYRTDINIGNCRHGFDSYIDVSPTGYQEVYLYAINVGEGHYSELGMKAIDIAGDIASFGYDYPTDNQEISDRKFLFQGWVQPNKEISNITCSINDGEKYITSNLYTRPDVPNSTAFRAEIATSNLKLGNNKISVCVNFSDGTGVVAGVRTVNRTRPEIIAALDYPETDCHIETDQFLCQGWVDSDKEVESITIRVNNGAYYPLDLYKREDVPFATAFRKELSSEILSYGKNAIALCVNYKDGTGAVPIIREFYKDYAIALDNPHDNDIISTKQFLFQGWVASTKTVKSVKCIINNETLINTGLYKREDVPFADAFRAEIRSEYLNVGNNQIKAIVEYTDETTVSSITRTIYLKPEIGDTNLDRKITISDVTAIQRHLSELELFTDEQIALADTNGDGVVNITDATHLQKYLAEFDGIVLGKS